MTPTHAPAEPAAAEAQDDPGGPDEPGRSPGQRSGYEPIIDVADATGTVPTQPLRELARLARAAVALAGGRSGEIRARLVGDAEIARLHRETCGVAGPTDVITFDFSAGDAAATGTLDADLVIGLDEARRAIGLPPGPGAPAELVHELLLYILHGALHCLGEDDRDDPSSRRMHAREDEILAAIGVGPVFAARRHPPDRAGGDRSVARR